MAKTVFITGASSGFGKSSVDIFAKSGWNVACTVRSHHMDHDMFAAYPNVKLYELEVTDYAQVLEVAAQAIADFGKIDVVVNNAGYCLMGPTETSTMEQIEHQFETNVFGLFAVTKAFIPHFRKNMDGIFINLASASAQFNYPYISAYGGSKWAVRGITESLGIELAPFNIVVKAVYPGLHATRIFTKLVDGTDSSGSAYPFYKNNYDIFNSAQVSVDEVTAPSNIANEIFKAASTKGGKLHIVSGGDAKLYRFLKTILSARMFQKLQIRSISQTMSNGEISFFKWLMGSNTATLHVGGDTHRNAAKQQ